MTVKNSRANRVVANQFKCSYNQTCSRSYTGFLLRNEFKILLLEWSIRTGTAPRYIEEFCVPVRSQPGCRSLHSAACGDLRVPPLCTSLQAQRTYASDPSFETIFLCIPVYILLHFIQLNIHFLVAYIHTCLDQLESHTSSTFGSCLKGTI